jgi:hypothetical protein
VNFLEWFSRNNVFIMRAIPFVALPTFIVLGGSLWLGWNSGTNGAVACARCLYRRGDGLDRRVLRPRQCRLRRQDRCLSTLFAYASLMSPVCSVSSRSAFKPRPNSKCGLYGETNAGETIASSRIKDLA